MVVGGVANRSRQGEGVPGLTSVHPVTGFHVASVHSMPLRSLMAGSVRGGWLPTKHSSWSWPRGATICSSLNLLAAKIAQYSSGTPGMRSVNGVGRVLSS